LFARSVQ